MPVNLLAIVFNWFATHLVLFSLLGFVFVGLLVFGVIDIQGAAPAGRGESVSSTVTPHPENRTPPASDLPAAAMAEPGRAGAALEKADVGGEEARSKKAGRPAPKLIGGSLPIYGQPGEAPAARGVVSGRATEPFRLRTPCRGLSSQPVTITCSRPDVRSGAVSSRLPRPLIWR